MVGGQHPVVEANVQLRQPLVGSGGGQPLQQSAEIIAKIADGTAQKRRQTRYPIYRVAAQQELK
jgi:hypothetical protein